MVCQSSRYKIVKVIKLFKKIVSKDSGIVFMIIIISFYNCYLFMHLFLTENVGAGALVINYYLRQVNELRQKAHLLY